jgi:hypothetical protein
MAGPSPYFAIRNYQLNTSEWEPIQAPIACNYWVVRGDANMLICSDDTNPTTTQDVIDAGVQEGVMEKQNPVAGERYPAGAIFGYVMAQTGTVNVRMTFAL